MKLLFVRNVKIYIPPKENTSLIKQINEKEFIYNLVNKFVYEVKRKGK